MISPGFIQSFNHPVNKNLLNAFNILGTVIKHSGYSQEQCVFCHGVMFDINNTRNM